MRRFFSFLFCVTFVACAAASAQFYYSAGSDPLTRWRTINTEHYEIIYPEGTDSLARRYAANMEAVRNETIVRPLRAYPKRTSIILHPYALSGNDAKRSNTPVRLEIYTTPDMYSFMSEPWEYTTAIAKSRHLGHEELLDRGFLHALYYIAGNNMRLPGDMLLFNNFYWLGDEKVTVTQLSNAGVGRSADFLKVYRTAFIEDDLRNYDRWKLGSYKYMTPGQDAFGYILAADYMSKNEESEFGAKWADFHIKHPFKALLFANETEAAGTFKNGVFNEHRDSLAAAFKKDFEQRKPFTPSTVLLPAQNYTEYMYLSYSESQDVIYAVKSCLNEVDRLVRIDLKDGSEKFLMFFNPESSSIAAAGDMLYWSETVHKGAWELNDYSEIFSYDTSTGKVRRLTANTRYFNPAPNESGEVIAVGEQTVSGESYLTILSSSGSKEFSVKAPEGGTIMETDWIEDTAYCLVVTRDGLGLYSYDDEGWKVRIAPQWQNIADISGNELMIDGRITPVITFGSDVDGVSNIYAYVPESGEVWQLINSPYGAAFAGSYKDGALLYGSYGSAGYSLAVVSEADFEMKKTDMSAPYIFPLAEDVTRLASNAYPKPDEQFIAGYMDEDRYPSRDYSKPGHWFHVHSWLPAYVNMGIAKSSMASPVSLGAMVMSQNKLGTVSAILGYSYGKSPYSSDWLHGGHAAVTFKGSIPRIELSAEVGSAEKMYYVHLNDEYGKPVNTFMFADEGKPYFQFTARIYQPLSYSMLGLNANVLPYISLNLNNNLAVDFIGGRNGTADYIQAGVSADLQTETAHAAIYPRWGVGLSVDRISPAAIGKSSRMFTSQFSTQLSAYLPGIGLTHGASVSFQWVQQNWKGGNAVFPTNSLIELPRGYKEVDFLQLDNARYWKAAVDYALPIYLGDTNLGGVLYLRRLQAIPFFDYAVSKRHNGDRQNYYSAGTDLLVDCDVLRLKFDISLGVRYAYNKTFEPMQKAHTFQFLLKTNL